MRCPSKLQYGAFSVSTFHHFYRSRRFKIEESWIDRSKLFAIYDSEDDDLNSYGEEYMMHEAEMVWKRLLPSCYTILPSLHLLAKSREATCQDLKPKSSEHSSALYSS